MYRIQGADLKEYGPISADQIRQWIGENRLNRFTLCSGADGIWKPLGQFLEFADALPPAAAAAAASVTPPISGGTEAVGARRIDSGLPDRGRELALSRVKPPAICMLILAAISALYAITGPLFSRGQFAAFANQPGMDAGLRAMFQNWAAAPMWVWIGVMLFSWVINGIIILGAIRMMNLRSYGLSMAAAIISVLPCSSACCCLGIGFGIWGVVVLNSADVKPHFTD